MKRKNKQHYRFWRWLIMSVIKIPKLYVLVWGLLGVCALAVAKTDIVSLICGLSQ